jgi:glycosyltransferase involved in cell wall biosynthesis
MSRNPTILLVVPRLNIGGAEACVVTTALGLHKRKYNVIVASWGGKLADMLKAEGIKHYLVPIRLNAYLVSLMLTLIIKKNKVNLVHAHSAAAASAALISCQKLNIPLIFTAHGTFGLIERERKLEHADRIICVSESLRQTTIERGFKKDNLIVLYNGVDYAKFTPRPEEGKAVRQELGISENAFVLGIISRIKNLNRKGHGDILHMLDKYQPQQAQDWRLLVLGKGNGLAKVKQTAKNTGLSHRVHFAGHQVDISRMLQAMDVVLLPSPYETFGLVLAEAMAAGKPVVAYNSGGVPEVVEDGVNGFLTAVGDIDAMYEKINLLYENPQLALTMGNNGLEKVQKLFGSEKMLDNLDLLYRQVVADKINRRTK